MKNEEAPLICNLLHQFASKYRGNHPFQEKIMPIFEFLCEECGAPFEELVPSANAIDRVTCPECGSAQVKKRISTFASRIAGSSSHTGGSRLSAASCGTGSV